jgi:hypothetical protein
VAVAPPLPELPATIALADVAPPAGPLRPVVGIADLTGAPVPVDLRRANLVVVGPPLSGRSTVLATVAAGLRGPNAGSGLRGPNAGTGLGGPNAGSGPRPLLVGLGSSASPLAAIDGWDVAGFGRTRLKAAIDDAVAAVAGEDGHEVRVVVMIDGVEDLDAPDLAAALDALVGAEATRTVAVVEPATLARSFSGWIAQLKANRSILQLQPSSALDVEAVCGRRVPLRPDQPFPPGRGVLVDRLGATLVQVAVPGPGSGVQAPQAGLGSAPQ